MHLLLWRPISKWGGVVIHFVAYHVHLYQYNESFKTSYWAFYMKTSGLRDHA
jgi:predicted signal transduction protein with EAL and GGDEF domain